MMANLPLDSYRVEQPGDGRAISITCIALSIAEAEAEYIALASTIQEVTWMRRLMENKQVGPTVVHEDN